MWGLENDGVFLGTMLVITLINNNTIQKYIIVVYNKYIIFGQN
jgi:hypothetical protein